MSFCVNICNLPITVFYCCWNDSKIKEIFMVKLVNGNSVKPHFTFSFSFTLFIFLVYSISAKANSSAALSEREFLFAKKIAELESKIEDQESRIEKDEKGNNSFSLMIMPCLN